MISEGKNNYCHNSTLTNDSIPSRIQNIQSNFETIDPKHKHSVQGTVRETLNVNVIDQRITEDGHSTTKVDTIKS